MLTASEKLDAHKRLMLFLYSNQSVVVIKLV